MTEEQGVEPIIDRELPIIDAHHHLWFLTQSELAAIEESKTVASRAFPPAEGGASRYLFDELLEDLCSGHNVIATVYVDAHAMYRAEGPAAYRSLGEVEFANGMAAMSDSGLFGPVQACVGIVGNVDLRIGRAAGEVLEAHVRAAGGRYRGVRCAALSAHDADASILGGAGSAHLLRDRSFRQGFACLKELGLTFDAWLLQPQLPELFELAGVFPDTQIILNHTGGPVGIGRYAGARSDQYALWRENIEALSKCSNVSVKLGGLGMPMPGFASFGMARSVGSAELADEWRPYVEACIESFGVGRCMFESNFPIDARTCTYRVLWNTFKRLAAGASQSEKASLFGETARRVYRLKIRESNA